MLIWRNTQFSHWNTHKGQLCISWNSPEVQSHHPAQNSSAVKFLLTARWGPVEKPLTFWQLPRAQQSPRFLNACKPLLSSDSMPRSLGNEQLLQLLTVSSNFSSQTRIFPLLLHCPRSSHTVFHWLKVHMQMCFPSNKPPTQRYPFPDPCLEIAANNYARCPHLGSLNRGVSCKSHGKRPT